MTKHILNNSLRKLFASNFTTLICFVTLTILGIFLVAKLSLNLEPQRYTPKVNVDISWKGASAKVLEHDIIGILEGEISKIEGLESILSRSQQNRGYISTTFDKQVDIKLKRYEVVNVVRKLYPSFPKGVDYPTVSLGTMDEGIAPFMNLSLQLNKHPEEIQHFVQNWIRPKLSKIKGIAKIDVFGLHPKEILIQFDHTKLLYVGIEEDELKRQLQEQLKESLIGTTITLNGNTGHKRGVSIRSKLGSDSIDLTKLPIKLHNNTIVNLGSLAVVEEKEAVSNQYYRINGKSSCNIAIYPSSGENIIVLSNRIKHEIKEISKTYKEFSLEITHDRSTYLVKELKSIFWKTVFTIFILLFFVIIIYKKRTYIFIILCSLIVNLFVSVIFYYILDIQIHLYSLAGITLSLGIIIDNLVIVLDHLRQKGDGKVLLAILAATLTTIGGTSIIFFLSDEAQINLYDFALVVIIDLLVSLCVAYFFLPALFSRMQLSMQYTRPSRPHKASRFVSSSFHFYLIFIVFMNRRSRKIILLVLLLFTFGLPVTLLPKKVNTAHPRFNELYNNMYSDRYFQNKYLPLLESTIGGVFNTFLKKNSMMSNQEEPHQTVLTIRTKLPGGSTIAHVNTIIKDVETFLLQYHKIDHFITSIPNPLTGEISVYFTPEIEKSDFPEALKYRCERYVNKIGGADWYVEGVGDGFTNALFKEYHDISLSMEGYNYEELYQFALRASELLKTSSQQRIKEVFISNSELNNKSLSEFNVLLEDENLLLRNSTSNEIWKKLDHILNRQTLGFINDKGQEKYVYLQSKESSTYDVWQLMNTSFNTNGIRNKIIETGSMEKLKSGIPIDKFDQNFHLNLNFDYQDNYQTASKFTKDFIYNYRNELPMGYTIERANTRTFKVDDFQQYIAILVVVVIVFFICAILFESLSQPFAIILMIPIAFIGTFVTYIIFPVHFNQGGYAALILLTGLAVNSAIYIVNDYNRIRKKYPTMDQLTSYTLAFKAKITPILITLLTTIFGFIPFLLDGKQDQFWFNFALGSIGGLLFSLVGLLICLPIFIVKSKKHDSEHQQ